MGLSKNSKLKEVMARPEAMAIIEEYVPGASKMPELKLVAGMTLAKIASLAPDRFDASKLDEIDVRLQALGD